MIGYILSSREKSTKVLARTIMNKLFRHKIYNVIYYQKGQLKSDRRLWGRGGIPLVSYLNSREKGRPTSQGKREKGKEKSEKAQRPQHLGKRCPD